MKNTTITLSLFAAMKNTTITLSLFAAMFGTSITADAATTMALRLDATQFTSAGAISTWEDSSGNGHDATASGASQPIVNLTGQNSLPTVEFDGSDDLMSIGHTYTAGTVFVVASYDTANFNAYDGIYGGDANVIEHIYFTGAGSSSAWFGVTELDSHYDNGGSATSSISTLNQWNLFSGTDSTPQSLNNWIIGNDRGIAGRGWDGAISEVIVYEEALSDFDRMGVEVYLNDKWGLPTDLGYADGTYNTDLGALGLIPEPSSYALIGGCLALGAVILRRRQR